MTQNRWQLGTMYYGGRLNGNSFYVQPSGPFTAVTPTQRSGPFLDWPVPGMVITEYIPWWSPGCGHSIKFWSVIREFDYPSNQSCALITCSICNYIENVYMPFEEWLNPIQHAIVVA